MLWAICNRVEELVLRIVREGHQELLDAETAYRGEEEKRFVARRYGWEDVERRTLEIYEKAVHKN